MPKQTHIVLVTKIDHLRCVPKSLVTLKKIVTPKYGCRQNAVFFLMLKLTGHTIGTTTD